MPTAIRLLSFSLFLAASAVVAQAADIELSDGRVFHDAVVVSQTPGRISIRHREGISQVEKYLLTGDLAARYPADAATVEREDSRHASAAQVTERRRAESAMAKSRRAAVNASDPDREARAEAAEWARMARIRDCAEAYARSHFERLEGSSWSFSSGAEIDDPVPMAGWNDQWRVSGLVALRDIHSQGGLTSQSRKFEVIVKWENGRFRVIDFNLR